MICDRCYFNTNCQYIGRNKKSKVSGCSCFKDRELVVELKCEVGDMVYIADGWGKKVQEFVVKKIGIFEGGHVLYYQGDFEQPITPDLWGKTVFLTREGAQHKLDEMKG